MYCVQFTVTGKEYNLLFRTRRGAERHLRRISHLSPRLGVRGLPMLGEDPRLRFFSQVFAPWEKAYLSGWYVWSNDQ
jgi:hypothetical protein